MVASSSTSNKSGLSTYEEMRQERLEQNKKKLEQLNLTKLSQALLHSTISPKSTPMKKVKQKVARQPVDPSTVRRSSRNAEKPAPNYKEVPVEPMGRPRSYRYARRDLSNRVYASDDDREYALERAEVLHSGLGSKFPGFIKPMLQSHVTGGFWLGLPVQFCKTHLPKHDETVTLVDEQDEEYATRYLALKTGLSGGWRGFSIDHELVDGDALVFQLIGPTKFKVQACLFTLKKSGAYAACVLDDLNTTLQHEKHTSKQSLMFHQT